VSDEGRPERILVVANETVGGRALIDAVRAHAEKAPVEVRVVCPQNQPRAGYIVYDEHVRAAAENRLETTIAQLRDAGVEAEGEVLDPDPYAATMDALHDFPADRIVISTHPETRSGWMRRGLVDRVRDASGAEVEHVVVDLDAERDQATHTLVVANQTVGGRELLRRLKEKTAESPHRFVVVTPYGGTGQGEAADRLAATLRELEDAGLDATGQVMGPDPFTAVQQALQLYLVDEIVISTFPETRSGWLRADLVERVRRSTSKPVEHVVAAEEGEGAASPEEARA
jgi:hypothetical protein